MIYYTSWLSQDQRQLSVQSQQNDARAAGYYEILRPARLVAGRIAAGVRQALHFWRSRSRRRTTVSELSRLNDRMLKDIGVTRAQIQALARDSALPIEAATTRQTVKAANQPTSAQSSCEVIPLISASRRRRTLDAAEHSNRRPQNAA